MPPDFATELARKCVQDWEEYGTIHADLHLYIAAAMREALEEAEKIADNWPAECLEGDGEQNCGPGIAGAIAALRGGTT